MLSELSINTETKMGRVFSELNRLELKENDTQNQLAKSQSDFQLHQNLIT